MTETTQPPTKELAKTAKSQIRDLLQGEEFKRQVAKALPRAMSSERFARIALTATYKNPKLLLCTRESLLQCLIELCAIGLEPDGRRAHLIPFKDQCTLIIDYKGIAELIRRNGDVAYIHCDVVGENDSFVCRFGTGGKLEHIPVIGDRGRIYCAYSFVRLKDGTEEFDLMATEEINRVRQRSRASDDGPWVTDWNEMAKKTVFRRHSKTLPLSPEVRDVVERDDESFTETEHFNSAKPAVATVASAPARDSRFKRPSKPELPAEELPLESQAPAADEQREPEPSADPYPEPQPQPRQQKSPPNLADQVDALLTASGFNVAELSVLLRQVKLIKTDVTELTQIPDKALDVVAQDWDNCRRRLENNRKA